MMDEWGFENILIQEMRENKNKLRQQRIDAIREMKKELSPMMRNQLRIDYLIDQLDDLVMKRSMWRFLNSHPAYSPVQRQLNKELTIDRLEKDILKIRRELQARTHTDHEAIRKAKDLAYQEVELARSFPIEELLAFNEHGFAFCPAHQETNPSLKLYAGQNKAYCFSCKRMFDPIDVEMTLHDYTFTQAVKSIVAERTHDWQAEPKQRPGESTPKENS